MSLASVWVSAQLRADCQRMPGQKFLRGHAAAAFALELGDAQCLFAARNHDAVFVRVENLTGRA